MLHLRQRAEQWNVSGELHVSFGTDRCGPIKNFTKANRNRHYTSFVHLRHWERQNVLKSPFIKCLNILDLHFLPTLGKVCFDISQSQTNPIWSEALQLEVKEALVTYKRSHCLQQRFVLNMTKNVALVPQVLKCGTRTLK